MPDDEIQRLEATIAALQEQQREQQQELAAAKDELEAVRASAEEARIAARLERGSPRSSFLARNWAPLLASVLMAPLIVVLVVLLDGANTRARECQAQLAARTPPLPPPVPVGHVSPPTEPRTLAAMQEGTVGVPACDDYINKYAACLETRLPQGQQALVASSIEKMREAWRKAAATEAGRRSLAQACKTAYAATRKAMASFDCQW